MPTNKLDPDAFRKELSLHHKNLIIFVEQATEILLIEAIPEKIKDKLDEDTVTCIAIMQKYGACLQIEDKEAFKQSMHQINTYIDDELEFIGKFSTGIDLCLKLYDNGPEFSRKKILDPNHWRGVKRNNVKSGTFMGSKEVLKEEELSKYETPFIIVIIQAFIEYLGALLEYASVVAEFPNLTTEAVFFVQSAQIEIKEIQQDYLVCLTQEYIETLQMSQSSIIHRINILHKALSDIEVKFDQYLVYSDDTPEISIRSEPEFFIGETIEC